MSIALLRVDERLIHGQVVVGWGGHLHPDRIVVVDDDLAASDWEQELYVLGLPPDVTAEFASIEQGRARLDAWRQSTETIFVLTRDIFSMLSLARGGVLRGAEVNIGGIHHSAGRREALPYVYLSGRETDALRALAAEGADISARDLPGTRRVALAQLLGDDSR